MIGPEFHLRRETGRYYYCRGEFRVWSTRETRGDGIGGRGGEIGDREVGEPGFLSYGY